jgi:hypothetical protein
LSLTLYGTHFAYCMYWLCFYITVHAFTLKIYAQLGKIAFWGVAIALWSTWSEIWRYILYLRASNLASLRNRSGVLGQTLWTLEDVYVIVPIANCFKGW